MSIVRSIRYTTIVLPVVLAILWCGVGAAQPPGAAEVLEVKVLEAQVDQGEGERFDVLYRMEVLSVVRSASGVEAGETVTVRSYGQSKEALARGWVGTAHLIDDPKDAGTGGARQFVVATESGGLVELPPGPPSATFTPSVPKGRQ
jgi:hypothetical protein